MDRWIGIRVNDVQHLWHVGTVDDEGLDDLIHRARKVLGYPHGDPVIPGDVRMFEDVPHEVVLGAGQVHDIAELRAVPAAHVKAYRDKSAETVRERRLDDARRVLAQLPAADRAALHAELAKG